MHDAACKRLFSHRRMVEYLLRGFLTGKWTDALDFATLEKLPAEFVSEELLRRRTQDCVRFGSPSSRAYGRRPVRDPRTESLVRDSGDRSHERICRAAREMNQYGEAGHDRRVADRHTCGRRTGCRISGLRSGRAGDRRIDDGTGVQRSPASPHRSLRRPGRHSRGRQQLHLPRKRERGTGRRSREKPLPAKTRAGAHRLFFRRVEPRSPRFQNERQGTSAGEAASPTGPGAVA